MTEKAKPTPASLRDLRKLEAFSRVYEQRSFSRAGEVMFLSQPTVSSHVANLEAELGVKLFDRLGKQILPTAAADILYVRAREVFDALDRVVLDIVMLRDKVMGEINLGCSTIPGRFVIPAMVGGFAAAYPDVSFSFTLGDTEAILAGIMDGELHFGVVGYAPTQAGLQADRLFGDPMVIVGPPRSGKSSLDDLLTQPWIMREKGSATRAVLEERLRARGVPPESLNVRCRVDSTEAALSLVGEGMGLTASSRLAARSLLESGRATDWSVPELAATRSFYLVRRGDREMFPALNAFRDHLIKACAEL